MRHLSDAFPGVQFIYEAEAPPGSIVARQRMSLFLRLWLFFFGVETSYPSHRGYFERSAVGAVEFYFVAAPAVPWIRATSYGMTAGLDDNFNRLNAATGWVVEYPRF